MSAKKQDVWLKYFLDEGNKITFLNRTESALAAGYTCKDRHAASRIGSRNYRYFGEKINKWLDEEGLSEATLKMKLLKLLDAKEKKFFAFQGEVCDTREVEALETQRKTLDMAIKMRGLYAPDRHEHMGPNGGPIQTINGRITSETDPKEAAQLYAQMIKQSDD